MAETEAAYIVDDKPVKVAIDCRPPFIAISSPMPTSLPRHRTKARRSRSPHRPMLERFAATDRGFQQKGADGFEQIADDLAEVDVRHRLRQFKQAVQGRVFVVRRRPAERRDLAGNRSKHYARKLRRWWSPRFVTVNPRRARISRIRLSRPTA